MKETTLKSSITQNIYVETHNDYESFILHQTTIGNKQRPAVESSIVMTSDQLRQLVAAQQGVHWTARVVAQVKSFLSSLWSAVLRRR